MKNSNCRKDFIRYSSSNVLGMIGLSCYILADTFFVSKALGSSGLSALNLAIPVYSFIHGSGLMIGMGGGIRYSIAVSQNNRKNADRIFTNSALLTLLLSAVFFSLGLWKSGQLARLLGADETVFLMSAAYLKTLLLFAPMFMTNNLLLCFVRNDGAPHLSMTAMLVGSFSNIILDYLFIFPLRMGILGAALATGLAPVISILILSPYFLQKKNHFHLCRHAFSGVRSFGIFCSGLPFLITEVSSGIVMILFNMLILKLQGNIGVAAYGIIANLSLVVLSIYTGIAQGIQPIVSSSYGRGNTSDVRSILRYALTAMAVFSVCIYLGIFLGAGQIAGIFNSEQNVLLQDLAVCGLRLYFTAIPFAGFNIILSSYFTSTESALSAHAVSFLRGFVILIPMAFLLSGFAGITGIWCTFPATEFVVSLISLSRFFLKAKTDSFISA